MIVALTTSSPQAGVALFEPEGDIWTLVAARSQIAERNASEVVLSLLDELGSRPEHWTAIVVDAGPGSFTGVKVGMTMAKLWAHQLSIPLGLVSSFDCLADVGQPAMVALKKSEVLVREANGEFLTMSNEELAGCGAIPRGYTRDGQYQTYPIVERVGQIRDLVVWADPLLALPEYGRPPSISQPRRPYRSQEHGK